MSSLEEKLEQGIAAAQAGHKQKARTLLAEVVEVDEGRVEAWLWLSQVVDSLEEQTIHLGVRLLRTAEREALVEMIESGRIESTEKAAEAAQAE